MFLFMCGLMIGSGGTYFVMRFRNALKVFVSKTETKIEETLKK